MEATSPRVGRRFSNDPTVFPQTLSTHHDRMNLPSRASAILLLLLSLSGARGAVLITNFGFDATNGGSWTYTPATSTISGTEGPGDLIFGTPANLDLGSDRWISLSGNATTAPAGSFTITLEDNIGQTATAEFQWTQFTGGSTRTQALSYTSFDFAHVVGWSLDSGASFQAVNASFSQLTVVTVPEPSTCLLLLGGMAIAGKAASLRRKEHRKCANT
jgi:hypothetical protein